MKLPASRIKPIEIDVKLEGLSFVNQATMIYNSGGRLWFWDEIEVMEFCINE